MNETVAPTPKSPPKYPDFCGRRKLQLEVQILNREVAAVQEELQSLERLQPVSVCCKEVNEFVAANPDPLVPINKKRHGPCCRFWRWLGSKLCCCLSCIFCCPNCCKLNKPTCNNCCPNPKKLCCCSCFDCNCNCFHCPKFTCCKCPSLGPCCCCYKCTGCFNCSSLCCCDCWGNSSREKSNKCCCSPTISCPEYSCGCVFDCPKCTNVRVCPKCTKPCCVTGCLC